MIEEMAAPAAMNPLLPLFYSMKDG